MKTLKLVLSAAAMLSAASVYGQKNLGLEASPNFRELGGIQIDDQYTIKDDMLYRSGSFSHLPEGDIEKLEQTSINTVVDFRSDFEIESEPDDIPASLHAEQVSAQIGSLDPNTMKMFMKVLMDSDFSEAKMDSLMVMANQGFVENIHDFKPLFDHLLEKDAVILFHCTAGKDRTGLASSMILHALGADWDTIMADYLRSNEAAQKIDTSKLEMYGIPKDRAQYMGGVKATYLKAAWAGIEEKYGSMDAMMEQEFGIGEKEKKQLKKKYLSKK